MPAKHYAYVFFDLDGTIIDPKVGITNSVNYSLKQFDIDVPDLKSLEKFIGPPLKQSYEHFYHFSPEQAIKAVDFYRVYYTKTGIHQNITYDGILELFQKLKEENKILFIVTSKPTVYAKQIAAELNFSQFFQEIIGSNLDLTKTSKQELVAEAIKKTNPKTDLASIIMIGDRSYDIIGAQQNVIDTLAVEYGYGTKNELVSCNPTYIAKTVEDLFEILL